MPFRAVNRVVRRHVHVVRIGLDDKSIGLGNIGKPVGLAGCHFVDVAEEGRRLHGLVGPYARIQIAAAALEKIHGVHGELQAAAALHKDDMIVVRHLKQPAHEPYRFVLHVLIRRAAVADFYNAHPRMIKIEKFSLYRFQYVQRHRRRSGVKIIHSFHTSHVPSCGEPQGNSLACNKKTPVPKKGREYTPALPPSLPFGHLVALYRAYPSNSSFDAPERNALLPCCLAPFRQLSVTDTPSFFLFHRVGFVKLGLL